MPLHGQLVRFFGRVSISKTTKVIKVIEFQTNHMAMGTTAVLSSREMGHRFKSREVLSGRKLHSITIGCWTQINYPFCGIVGPRK